MMITKIQPIKFEWINLQQKGEILYDLDICNSIWQTNPAELTGYEFWAQKKVKVKVKYSYLSGFIVTKTFFVTMIHHKQQYF